MCGGNMTDDVSNASPESTDGVSGDEAFSSNPNEVVEIIEGKVEKVSVSKHPEASIPQTELSLADIKRSQSHPVRWVVYLIVLLAAIIAPYWLGRVLAVERTAQVVKILSHFSPQGVALISWTVAIFALATFALSFVEAHVWLWRNLFLLSLALEQLIGGVSLLKFRFWYSTYVVYNSSSVLVNAANLGIIAALLAAGLYAVLFVGLLIGVKKDSPLNILTRSWASFLMFFIIEAIALLIILFTDLIVAF
jgi:hypothetical protein